MARLRTVPINQASAGTDELVPAPTPSRRNIVVVSYLIVMAGQGSYRLEAGDGTDLSGDVPAEDTGGVSFAGAAQAPALVVPAGEALQIVTASGAARGHLTYFIDN